MTVSALPIPKPTYENIAASLERTKADAMLLAEELAERASKLSGEIGSLASLDNTLPRVVVESLQQLALVTGNGSHDLLKILEAKKQAMRPPVRAA